MSWLSYLLILIFWKMWNIIKLFFSIYYFVELHKSFRIYLILSFFLWINISFYVNRINLILIKFILVYCPTFIWLTTNRVYIIFTFWWIMFINFIILVDNASSIKISYIWNLISSSFFCLYGILMSLYLIIFFL
jgi:hypothetical protein